MWNLPSNTETFTVYQPTSFAGALVVADGAFAYDKPVGLYDDYPYLSAASLYKLGSTVEGTPDTTYAIATGFAAVPKANFGLCTVYIALSVDVTNSNGMFYSVSGHFRLEYSADGGSTWHVIQTLSTSLNGVASPYPASAVSVTIPYSIENVSVVKNLYSVTIPSAQFTSGLGDLQIRMSSSTLWAVTFLTSVCEGYVYDIRCKVS